MPIVDVEIILRPDEELASGLAGELADALGTILESRPGGTWVKVRGFSRDRYAENGGAPDGVFPIVVQILKSRLDAGADLQSEAEQITGAVARICGRPPENVHLIYLPEGSGRVAFGGELVP